MSMISFFLRRHFMKRYFKKFNIFLAFFFLILFILYVILDGPPKNKNNIESIVYSGKSKSTKMADFDNAAITVTYSDECCLSPWWMNTLQNLSNLSGAQVMQYFLWTNGTSCQLTHDFGGAIMEDPPSGIDGQKAVCIDPIVAPKPGECIVYSFGISDDWSFDEQMELYGCEVFAFDPSIKKKQHDHKPRIHFYGWGLGHQNENITGGDDTIWQMRTLSSIYETLSHLHGHVIIDYLKIDIEFSEWQVLPQIIQSGMLSKVRQLGVEIHLLYENTINKYREQVKIIRELENEGMIRFDSKYNPWSLGKFTELKLWGSRCYEIAWYNSKLQRPVGKTSKYRDFFNSFANNVK